MIKVLKTKLDGVVIVEPQVFKDERGYFFESWNEQIYNEFGLTNKWIQDNESKSSYGVLRGLHYQLTPYTQAKLVRVISGKVLDVAVDIRQGSKTFGQYVSVSLSDENKRQLYIPRGFAHGFVVLSESATFAYKVDNKWSRESERGIIWNDPDIGIDWKIPTEDIILSEKDTKHPRLNQAETL